MITGQVTNITLEIDRFRVYFKFSNEAIENNTFEPNVTANDINNHLQERIDYYTSLENKLEVLKDILITE